MRRRTLLAAVLVIAAVTVVPGQEDELLPRTYSANLRIVNPPGAASGSRTAFLRMTIERWSADEERLGFARALRDGGAVPRAGGDHRRLPADRSEPALAGPHRGALRDR